MVNYWLMFGTDHRPINQSILNTSTVLNGGFSSITYKECNKLVYKTIMVENKNLARELCQKHSLTYITAGL